MEIGNIREKEINIFLERMANYSKKETLSWEQIYHELIFNKIPPNKQVDLSAYFDYWQEIFTSDPRTSVYVQEGWEFFCQFVNRDVCQKKPNIDPIKIYVTLKPEYLALGANQIFKFLSDNNIKHRSKIGRVLRDDNIVIRVYDLKEAKKLINFINSNEFLVKGHMDVSPFCFQSGIVGLAMDNYLSYNSVVCFLISKYLEYKKSMCQLNDVNCQDLYEFVQRFDMRQSVYNEEMNFIKSPADITVLNEIRLLFSKSLVSNDINDVYRHYYFVSKNRHLVNDMKKVNNDTNIKNNVNEQKNLSGVLEDLLAAMKGTATKYGDDCVYGALRKFLMSGDMTGFTRIDANGNVCRGLLLNHNYQNVRMEIYKNMIGIEKFLDETIPEFTFQRVTQVTDYFYNEFYKKNKDYSR